MQRKTHARDRGELERFWRRECGVVTQVLSSKCGRELKPTDSSKTGKNHTADLDRLATVETTVMDGVLR